MTRGTMVAATILAAALAGPGAMPALAQAGSGAQAPDTAGAALAPTRSPTLGDPGAVSRHRHTRRARRAAVVDHPAPSSQNGNAPDRAGAGAGAR